MRRLLCAFAALLSAGSIGATPLDAPDTDKPLDLWLTVGGVLTHPLSYDYEGVGFAYDRDLVSLG
ncbi:MAG: hypothetical protein ACOC2D_14645, partial [Spirochaetota bacterium]